MTSSFSPAARSDIYKQFRYLLKEAGPTIALRFRTKVEDAVSDAAETPLIGTPVSALLEDRIEVRSWPVPTFPAIRLYYTQRENEIHVIRVLHGKRDLARVLRRTDRKL